MRCRLNSARSLARFANREDGTATIEAVLWLPFFLALFGLLADVSMVFYGQSRILRIAQDANRNMSIGRLATPADTQNFVITQLGGLGGVATASTTVTAGLITTTVSIPMTALDMFGMAGIFKGAQMNVRAEHLMEI